MKRAAVLLLIGLLAGCTVGRKHDPLPDVTPIVEGQTTKREVLERLGVPDTMYFTSGRQVLVYRSDVERGMAIGAGYLGITLQIGHSHVGTDTAAVVIGVDGLVERVHLAELSDLARYDIWPFGT